MKNIEKQIAQGNKIAEAHQQLDLSVSEINNLHKRFTEKEATAGTTNAAFDIIEAAYLMGLARGSRNAQ